MAQNTNISITLTTKTRLEKALKNAGVTDPASVTNFAITGRLTDGDMQYIRENMAKTLQELDLSKASFKKNILPGFAFEKCTALTAVIFPDTIVEIGYRSFSECIGLKSVFIPASVVEIDTMDIFYDFWAFAGCDALTRIDVHPDNPVFASEDGVLLNKEKTELIKCPNGRQDDYFIPETVTYIGVSMFKGCTALTALDIPASVTEIGACVFWGCTALTSINIPASVVKIGCNVFRNCAALSSIFIPASVIEIVSRSGYDRDFHGCPAIITVHPDNTYYTSKNGILSYKNDINQYKT